MKRILHFLLAASGLLTLLVPVTGVVVHKLAATVFLLLCAVHAVQLRKKLRGRSLAMLAVVALAFVSGLFSLIFSDLPLVLAAHKLISLACVAGLAVHVVRFHRRLTRTVPFTPASLSTCWQRDCP